MALVLTLTGGVPTGKLAGGYSHSNHASSDPGNLRESHSVAR